ncbi:helicase-related protein [Novosphingobium sp. MMS21-SN21R]|uniref:helicase-related protein n=1 Tax=Novosphingobium sp. MMS21-SN21R TaxID=2969298 RepID=UPI002887E740|nr:helicase-related protein [Novosphingobium sp. MMS21-SN21R]MDT0506502.1 helicase-related protein [Novosphingobium sp. MMS21-SN21R]
MASRTPAQPRRPSHTGVVKAVLGPTNTGKTHLAIERLCAHSSGAIGFPLRLLAREVYDRVCAIKGPDKVALITGEERIEPKGARWHLCTVEAMPSRPDLAFVALDEAQLSADPERGHVFTDRLLHTRGREETMLLGSATLQPMIKALVPEAEIVSRPRFSTLTHVGAKKLSRIPPRSAIVAFSAEQVYVMAEMLRRFRGGAAVVMGALSPQTRNAQVAMYQSGEVDYLVATDAIGMGLNLDVHHVAFAGLSKYDGHRQRRLTTAEMAQIAGRAGRHQRDGTFGTLSGMGGHDPEFTPEEIYAIEEHRFPPLTRLFWREAEPRFDSLATLIEDLESLPPRAELATPPQSIDLAVLKRLSEEPEISDIRGARMVQRFWEVCRLPDFRQQGEETHSRFIARLWQDLRHGYLGADYVAQAIAQLDVPAGDIDTLQGRISAIRSWSYIAQRADWVLAKEEMSARARAVETRLSDALHARLTERFVNRRTTVLMRKAGADAGLLPVRLSESGSVLVDDEPIGHLEGFRFVVDPLARAADRKLLLAAAERHLPALLESRGAELLASAGEAGGLTLRQGTMVWRDMIVARLERGRSILDPRIRTDAALDRLPPLLKARVTQALQDWFAAHVGGLLGPLIGLSQASRASESGANLRALLLHLVEAGGILPRDESGLDRLDPAQRERMKKLGVRIGALDLFVPAMLRPAPLALWAALARVWGAKPPAPPQSASPVVSSKEPLAGYRRVGTQNLRVDLAEKLLHAAHAARLAAKGRRFIIDPALARSMGLSTASFTALLRAAAFRVFVRRPLPEGAAGPAMPPLWEWRPSRAAPAQPSRSLPPPTGAFAALAELVTR